MPVINLRTHYLHCTEDILVEVSDEVMEVILASIRKENAYNRQKYRYKAHYSLDAGDGIEHDALYSVPSPEEILLQKVAMEQLYQALSTLPDTQARRVHAHYILGKKKIEIAKAEGVNDSGVCSSVQIGVKNLRRYFEQKKWLQ
ncbi:MAG: sigma-70 family RNA polymerase sigma factor [Lachnospiraceae bacterium]|nr:sigma-70 family RNA polymerase sigma factor [Lachnospiraceae bacterium]